MIEAHLATRVLGALVREDYGGLRRLVASGGHLPPGSPRPGTAPWPGGILSRPAAIPGLRLDGVLALVRRVADPRDDVTAFERECRESLTTELLHDAVHAEVLRTLPRDERSVTGPGVFYDTLAAYADHPVHPAGRCRLGLSEQDLRRYAPEFHPAFPLRWAAVPRRRVTSAGEPPAWWPSAADVGLGPDPSRVLFPVHPLTARAAGHGVRQDRSGRSAGTGGQPVAGVALAGGPGVPAMRLETARAAGPAGLPAGCVLAPEPYLQVRPTLSMRTVCVVADPLTHVKVPLPTSTLGLRNRRSIVPRTLPDGAQVQRVLRRVLDREPGLPVLLADEQTYGHAGDPYLGYLVRRFPAGTAGARVVPVAALLARSPTGRYVVEDLTDDLGGFFSRYLRALFAWNVTLFVRYGIALEAHQQNVSVVLRPGTLELLLKDNDSPLVDPGRLRDALGVAFEPADRRLLSTGPEALARVFVTITLHLCAGAIAFGLADRGLLPLSTGLALIRTRLDEALGAFGTRAAFLRERTLDAETLPVKAMLTAGTLVDKARTGAADINKHYGPPAPNYLRDA
ncbi:IucA/IucC family protein [Actinomadura scrupuli]|uniref:IucA/IucC family protein n=1 Tax=Actinomadura scrupuli TaxID=559629 RepID=UPI003D952E12